MTCQMRASVIIIAMTVVIAGAYRSKRDVFSLNTDVISHHKTRPRNFFHDQSFIDKIIGQQTLLDVPVRDQAIRQQQALHEASLKERNAYPSGYPIFRQQPFKQNLFHMVTAFRDEPLFKDALLKDHESRGERAVFRNSPFEGQSTSLASEEIFGEQASAYRSQAPFKKQLLTPETPFKNLFHGQSPPGEQAPFQRETAYADFPDISKSIEFYQGDSYSKPFIDSYGRQKDAQSISFEEPTIYTEYDNHAHELSSMSVSPSKHLAALNAEMPATPPPTLVASHGSTSPASPVSSGMSEVHSSDAFKMKLGSASTLQSMLNGKCNTPVDSSSTMSNNAVTAMPSISVSTNQSSIVGHILTSLTTKPNSPVMATATPIMPSGNSPEPIHFHATKYGAVMAHPFISQNELKSKIHIYPLSEAPKSSLKIDEHKLKYLMPEVSKNNMKTDNQSPVLLDYLLSEEQKGMLKDDIQNSFVNNALPEVLKHDWSLQQFSHPETLSSYAPLSASGKMKLILPSPVASASAISWPLLTKHNVPEMLLTKSIIASGWSTSNNVPLEMNLPLDFMASMPNSLTASIPDSISGSITGGISTSIPGGITTDMPASIPTLNLGQSLHRVEQLRQTQEARNPWYPTGLQLQLGGFGGINYTLHTNNPAARPMELGIAKAGLTLPKLPQPHVPAFAKVSSQGVIASFAAPVLMLPESFLNNDT